MHDTSPTQTTDARLSAALAAWVDRRIDDLKASLSELSADEFVNPADKGLFHIIQGDLGLHETDYRTAIKHGLAGVRALANSSHNVLYARSLVVLSKAYYAVGDLRQAEMKARDALSAYRRAGDIDGQINAFNLQARCSFTRSDYPAAERFLADAVTLADENEEKLAQLTGNAGRVKILTGKWDEAARDLKFALDYQTANDKRSSQAINLLSIGYLALRQREFGKAEKVWQKAERLIRDLSLKREQVILLEYRGELALERSDLFRAKAHLSEAYHQGRLIAPDSALVSQASRRLAEVEWELDNLDDAMKHAQKALDLAQQLGERIEAALAMRTIARIFAAHGDDDSAVEHITDAIALCRDIGEPYDLARTLLVAAELASRPAVDDFARARSWFDEAGRIFRRLDVDYWLAETDYRFGVVLCQQGELARGFRKLSRAERIFAALDDSGRVRAVEQFIRSLADQAVAVSISEQNTYKVFGNFLTGDELSDLRDGHIEDVFRVLLDRSHGDRAILYLPEFASHPVVSSHNISADTAKLFEDNFRRLIGEEVHPSRPTLLLDTRRDPYINGLFGSVPEVVASVIVVPFQTSVSTTGYLYVDKLSGEGGLNPFDQAALNFAVGFSDLVAFKAVEMQKASLMEDNRRLRAQIGESVAFPNIITQNADMRALLTQVQQVVDATITVLIEGETGSGKDLLARAIHYNSSRRDKRFISVNCAALPETLLESELFGYRKGAFTGADRDKMGLFEEADGGTFFLDEIGDMPLAIQVKLLRVLESQEVVRLGESTPRKVDVRVLSATNKDLREAMAANEFRSDLYYRLAALSFRLPALRERTEDIPLLVNHFLNSSGKELSASAMQAMIRYPWPGNIRELENEVKKMILLAGDRVLIDHELLARKLTAGLPDSQVPATPENATDSKGLPQLSEKFSLYDFIAAHEKRFLIAALKATKGVKKHAAARLSIPESTLRLKLKEYDIDLSQLDD